MAFKMKGYPMKGDPKTMEATVASVMPDGGGLMVNTPNGVRKVKGGAQGIEEIKEGQTVTLNVGGAGELTLNGKKADDDRTGGPLKKHKKGY